MALKPVVISEKTDEVPLQVGGKTWFVTVRHITRAHDSQLMKDSIVKKLNETTRQFVEDQDPELYSLLYCRAAVTSLGERGGWRGLTPDLLAMVVELPADYVPRLATEDGLDGKPIEVVAFDAELAEFLWTQARPVLFQNPIYAHAQAVLVTTQLRKDIERGNLPGSFAA